MEPNTETQTEAKQSASHYTKKIHHKPKRDLSGNKYPFNYRFWVPEIEIENINSSPDYIRVISYNILCDSLVSVSTEIDESDLVNHPYMLWENRKRNLMKELNELNGDIMCLQEFERDEDLIKELGEKGFDCSFKPRTGKHSEGCAIFWKNKKFKVENLYGLEFNMNLSNRDISEIYDRDNICVFAVLSYVAYPDICFIIANTHVLYNNNRGDVKLAQVYQIINTLKLLKDHYSQIFSKVNLIFCGDMNSVPNSGVYKMITEGSVNCSSVDRRKISGQSQGSLSYLNPNKFKASLLGNVTSKFNEKLYKNSFNHDNELWFNSILCVESCLDTQNHLITLRYKENYKYVNNGSDFTLNPPIQFNSAYSEMLRKILKFLQYAKINNASPNVPPFNNVKELKNLEDLEVYGIKMGLSDIEKTLNFTKNLTLEPPFSFYGKGLMALVDYIFYNGNITPIRTLNIPDVNKVSFDIGYLPTEEFPSDHICLCVDFQILH